MAKPQVKEGFVEDEPADLTALKQDPAATEDATATAAAPDDAGAEAEQQPYVFNWPMRCKLIHKPIRNNKNEEVKEITFREPTGGDINRYGSPVRMTPDGMFDIDDKKMAMMMAALSGINLPFLERMDPRDWQSCAYRLKLFFHPDPTGWV